MNSSYITKTERVEVGDYPDAGNAREGVNTKDNS